MLSPDMARQLPYALTILFLFIVYGVLVRRGTISGRNILWSGLFVGAIAVGASFYHSYRSLPPGTPLYLLLFNPIMMALVTLYCVTLTYRVQRVEDIATLNLGDTKILVRVCLPSRIPDANALLLPTSDALRMAGGVAGIIGLSAGDSVAKSLAAHAPVGIGKVVETSGGKLAVGHIYHVAVHSALKDTAPATLRKGIETAALQARKGGAESIAVPLGALRGLNLVQSMEAITEGALKHRKAFGEIVFIAFDRRTGRTAEEVVRKVVAGIDSGHPHSHPPAAK